MNNKLTLNNPMILLFAMLGGGLLSILFGKELCWDLASYHYYNPYAFLHHRSSLDYWPSSFIQQYLSPTLDFLTYFLINSFSPFLTEFILGAIHGINFWLLYLIASLFIQNEFKVGAGIMIAIVGICGPVALPSIGSFQNDNLIALFVLGFVFLFTRSFSVKNMLQDDRSIFLAGLLLGAGTGLKLTAGIYVIGAMGATTILPLPISQRFRLLWLLGLSTALGICLTSGYWMLSMWQQHGNPLFPFLNNLFHSPEFAATNWRDMRFMPHGFWQSLFYPFYFSWDGRISDVPFRDFRMMVVYVLFLIASLPRTRQSVSTGQYWLFAFFIFSYIVWQYYFSIARYMLPLELLSPLIIYLLLASLIKDKHFLITTAVVTFSLLTFLMQPVEFARIPSYRHSFFNVSLPTLTNTTSQAVVLIAYPAYVLDRDPRPQTYLIPFFPSAWRFVGVPFIHNQYANDSGTTLKIHSIVSQTHSTIYLLTTSQNMTGLYQAALIFGLKASGACMPIVSDRQKITKQAVLLCPVIAN